MPADLASLDAIYVINLDYRTDRLAEMQAQLARVGLEIGRPPVRRFPAVRPADAGAFESIGARGCFLSHLGVLRDAAAAGHGTILILEDDADFTRAFVQDHVGIIGRLMQDSWDIAYLGYHTDALADETGGGETREVSPEVALRTTHAMLLRDRALAALPPYLEAMMARPAGDPAGGPMHVDGAYSWFRRTHPAIRTLAARTPWAMQRASRTDISGTGWKERLFFVPVLRRLKNRLRRR